MDVAKSLRSHTHAESHPSFHGYTLLSAVGPHPRLLLGEQRASSSSFNSLDWAEGRPPPCPSLLVFWAQAWGHLQVPTPLSQSPRYCSFSPLLTVYCLGPSWFSRPWGGPDAVTLAIVPQILPSGELYFWYSMFSAVVMLMFCSVGTGGWVGDGWGIREVGVEGGNM